MTQRLQFSAERLGKIPGPKTESLLAERVKLVPRGLLNPYPLFIRRAEGALVEDVDGNVFIDFAGGIGCLNVGHTPPEVVSAVNRQSQDFLFSCFHVAMHEPYLRVVEKLVGYMDAGTEWKGMLANSGAEAVENAIKLARAYTGRRAVVAFDGAFHGRTLMALGLTGKTRPYKVGFGPFPADIYRLPFAYCYRCPIHLSYPSCEVACANLLEQLFTHQIPASEVAAVVVEPVQGEGGFVTPPAEYFAQLKRICEQHGIVFILDEIQTGIARTGSMFAFQDLGVEPDLLVLSKSLAGGLPLSAVIGRREILDSPEKGGLGTTFGGNPVACAAALAVLEKAEREDLPARARTIGRVLEERIDGWKKKVPQIGEIRACGAMVGIEFVEDKQTKTPAAAYVAQLKSDCLQKGVIVLSAGSYANVVRFLIPLVIEDETLDQGLQIMEECLR